MSNNGAALVSFPHLAAHLTPESSLLSRPGLVYPPWRSQTLQFPPYSLKRKSFKTAATQPFGLRPSHWHQTMPLDSSRAYQWPRVTGGKPPAVSPSLNQGNNPSICRHTERHLLHSHGGEEEEVQSVKRTENKHQLAGMCFLILCGVSWPFYFI